LGHGETECLGYVHTMEDNADAVHSVLLELGIQINSSTILGWLCSFAFAELYPEYVKAWRCWIQQPAQIVKNEMNRDRAIRAVNNLL
jgi:hypothetical protein